MFNEKGNTDYIKWIVLISILLLAIEITFYNKGVLFSSLVSIGCIYFGKKRMRRLFGKILFWFGLISLIMTIFSMMTFKFLLIAGLFYVIVRFAQSKQNPTVIKPEVTEPSPQSQDMIRKRPFFENILFGQQTTPEHVYEWNDINIQSGVGDTIVDLSYTVLPKGEAVISIRNFVGNVRVLVPYDTDVSVTHSAITGSTSIFEYDEGRIFNKTIHFETMNYDQSEQKVKIVTSMLMGDLEVRRI
ncbi:cell wall-active antibiotics response protein [Bacillus sp. HMF5848]|uniref:cell wall-active antibiotics response protein LiaF n=1 Tax=Bacillus sp. HMF5848 TaxID=2495421 RepID=UPI000F7B7383|nr:cell wall-active antibiotics response protein LiaF [Bacillus sp. HMF5848]RSK26004.1 cell wall-active antibiotics response protein [Bacillus sp. HMF5848]